MKRILIVDDDTDILLSLKAFLTRKGYEVTTTTACSEGLKILASISPHLVLLDINVGDEDGRSMCKEIKTESEFKHIPVLMISANHHLLDSHRDYGADATLPKPFEFKSLLRAIEQMLATVS